MANNPLEREVWTAEAAYSPIFGTYASLVMKYTRREFSYQSGILNAFTRIISAMQERFGWRFLVLFPPLHWIWGYCGDQCNVQLLFTVPLHER